MYNAIFDKAIPRIWLPNSYVLISLLLSKNFIVTLNDNKIMLLNDKKICNEFLAIVPEVIITGINCTLTNCGK